MLHPRFVQPKTGTILRWQLELQNKIATVFYDGRIVPQHTETQHFYRDTVDGVVYPSVTTKTGILAKNHLKQWAVNRAAEYMVDFINNRDIFARHELLRMVEESKSAHKHSLNQASMWGSHGHDLVDIYVNMWIKTGSRPTENILSFAEPDISYEGRCAALSACKFFDDHTLFPIVSEKKIVSKKHAYAGTLDSLWLIGTVYKDRVGDKTCAHEWLEKRMDTIHCAKCNREEKLQVVLVDLKTSNQIFGYGEMAHHDYAAQVSAYNAAIKEMTGITCSKLWIVRLDKKKPHYEIGSVADSKRSFELFKHLSLASNYMNQIEEPLTPLRVKKVIVV